MENSIKKDSSSFIEYLMGLVDHFDDSKDSEDFLKKEIFIIRNSFEKFLTEVKKI